MVDISVIVPVYNMEGFLRETLDSIAAATPSLEAAGRSLEVVVIDDGSRDGSLRLAREYAASHPSVRVLSQPNRGLAAARNRAIAEARGRYLFPLDADDLLGPDFLVGAAEVLDRRPEVKVVSGQNEFFGDRTGAWRLPDFSLELLARRNPICSQ